eukprot:TRINITY_DN8482_c0_g1_i1.p1 TRINITY_DN8482_c0_g1~~TRINITY_DN8482_c0_g1_i1.p1  ORF type:complete len:135 (-),score=16.79 TRINITY_DN8482_c0_g1_i1:151-555(-)
MDDLFDSVLHVESDMMNKGYKEGMAHGRTSGLSEGRELGLKKGFELGSEIGYYVAWVQMWRQILTNGQAGSTTTMQPRIGKTMDKLDRLLTEYISHMAPSYERLGDDLEDIRRHYKMLCNQLGVVHKKEDTLAF